MKYGPKSNKTVASRYEYGWDCWSQWVRVPVGHELWMNLLELKFWSAEKGHWEIIITVLGFSLTVGRYVR